MKMVEAVAEDVTVLEAYGRLDSTTAKEFGDRLVALVQAGRNAIVVDLKNIAYISSAGFRVLLIANRATSEKQGKLALCGITGEVRRLFEIGAFLDQFLDRFKQRRGIPLSLVEAPRVGDGEVRRQRLRLEPEVVGIEAIGNTENGLVGITFP